MLPELTKILERLFAIEGNHDTTSLLECRDELIGFLGEEEQIFTSDDDENIITAKNGIRFIDANIAYAATTNPIEANKCLTPFFERLANTEKWNFYDIKFLIGALTFTENIKQTELLARKSIEAMKAFKADPRYNFLSGCIAVNMLSRLLYAKYFDEPMELDFELEDEFNQWFRRLRLLLERTDELKIHYEIAEIREALFKKIMKTLITRVQKFQDAHDEQMAQVVMSEVDLYMNSDKFMTLEELLNT